MFVPLHDENALRHIGRHYVTLGLIAANALIFFLVLPGFVPGGEGDLIYYAAVPAWIDGDRPAFLAVMPEPATLVTYAFLHADLWHLLGNMVFLWVFGDNVEDALGHVRFLAFYLACAAGAALVHAFVNAGSEIPLVGSSGAIAGVIAAYLMLHPRVRVWVLVLGRIPLRLSALWVLGAWIALQLWNAFVASDTGVAWWAHIGGLVTGAVLVVFMRRRGVPLFDRA